ncbi:hypothetical protein EOD08_07880 [Mesorhizobium sp. M6A.T.Ca.TU.002.02.2.1]|nr:hypothetical protein EOD08_07880 [Mesorhizobium sp. M6A.T.Ca.TU.002.02.2.1]
MARKPIPKTTQARVLIASRRRCCICYGLNRDTAIKEGQIAHLDHNNSNNEIDNLAFLCLIHHDAYDSTRSQSKGLTIGEVKTFREELLTAIGEEFSIQVHFGNVVLPKSDPYAGHFIRVDGEASSAEVEITPLPDGLDGLPKYAVTGSALWGTDREYGPNMGELGFIGTLVDDEIVHIGESSANDPHTVELRFDNGALSIKEENWFGAYGMNVNFEGRYRRT